VATIRPAGPTTTYVPRYPLTGPRFGAQPPVASNVMLQIDAHYGSVDEHIPLSKTSILSLIP
jgi:hypothetical protein